MLTAIMALLAFSGGFVFGNVYRASIRSHVDVLAYRMSTEIAGAEARLRLDIQKIKSL